MQTESEPVTSVLPVIANTASTVGAGAGVCTPYEGVKRNGLKHPQQSPDLNLD